jgi:hypothetical protein
MTLTHLTHDAVLAAVDEHDHLGREAFLQKYGFGPARQYSLIVDGRSYDSKAISGAAHGFARPDLGPLRPRGFSGGEATVKRTVERLGFVVEHTTGQQPDFHALEVGRIYSWDKLGTGLPV